MASDRQQGNYFRLTYPLDVPDYRVYAACRQFGLVESYRESTNDEVQEAYVDFIASNKVDELKPEHKINIEDGEITFKFLPQPDSTDDDEPTNESEDKTIAATSTKVVMPSPPDQPPNILDTLNDDCLDEIFTRLKWRGLMTLMNVCHRFRDVAERVAGRKRVITNDSYAPLWQAEQYLRKFGSSVRTIRAKHQNNMILLFLISKYCPNVDELEIGWVDERIIYEWHPLLKRVRKLRIGVVRGNGISPGSLNGILHPDSQIESLDIESSAELPPCHLPNLVELRLKDPRGLEPFLSINQRIAKLELIDVYFNGNGNTYSMHLPNLKEFTLNRMNFSDSRVIPDFAGISRLHTARLMVNRINELNIVLNAFIDGGVQVMRLIITSVWDLEKSTVDIICRMRSVEYLRIDSVSDVDLMKLATNAHNIKEIDLEWSRYTLKGVVAALKSLSCLSRLEKMTVKVEHKKTCKICGIMDIANKLDAIAVHRSDRSVDVKVYMIVTIAHDFEDKDALKECLDHYNDWLKYAIIVG